MRASRSGIEESLSLAAELHAQGRTAEAIRICRGMAFRQPPHAETLHSLGALECANARWNRALHWLRRAVSLRPNEARYRVSVAVASWQLGLKSEAILQTERGLQDHPCDSDLLRTHSHFLIQTKRYRAAVPVLDKAIAAASEPETLVAESAKLHRKLGEYARSEQRWRELLVRRPRDGVAILGLAGALNRQGRVDEAISCFRAAARMAEFQSAAGQGLLLTLHYSDRMTPRQIFREHVKWAGRLENSTPARAPAIRKARVIRVGYVSGDFRRHSVAHFFAPLLAHHHHTDVEVHCFSNAPMRDDLTARLRHQADAWHDIAALSDDEAADAIGKARVDVLVDLSGHTAHNRVGVFARRPAPVQVTYLGYPNTTGLRSIDYRFTDSIADPAGATDHLFSEKPMRLDPCFLCFEPWCARLPVGPPLEEDGVVTLATFAIREKLSPVILEAWSEILRRAPRSRLLVKCRANSDPVVRRELREFFRIRGLSDRRLILAGAVQSTREHLQWFRQADLVLDTYPYNGTTITCEALWMGTPVVTWRGSSHVSRVGASILTQVSLQDLIAGSSAEYVDKAVEAVREKKRLAFWRKNLRRAMRHSPLMDGERLATSIEAKYREMLRA